MKKLILLIIIGLFSVNLLAQTPEELIESGKQKIKSQETLFDGISELLDAKSNYVGQSSDFFRSQEYKKSIDAATKALTIEIDFSKAPRTNAFNLLKQADKLNTEAAYKNRSAAFLRAEMYDEAIADATWLLKNKASLPANIYTHRGIAYYRKDNYQKAFPDFTVAIKLNPKDWVNYFYLGEIHLSQSEWKKAILNFTKAISLNQKQDLFYRNRGTAYYRDNQLQKALIDLNKAIKMEATDPLSYFIRGKIYQTLKMTKKALADFNKALELDADFEDARKALEELEN